MVPVTWGMWTDVRRPPVRPFRPPQVHGRATGQRASPRRELGIRPGDRSCLNTALKKSACPQDHQISRFTSDSKEQFAGRVVGWAVQDRVAFKPVPGLLALALACGSVGEAGGSTWQGHLFSVAAGVAGVTITTFTMVAFSGKRSEESEKVGGCSSGAFFSKVSDLTFLGVMAASD